MFKPLDPLPRLFISGLVFGLVYILIPSWLFVLTRIIISWDVGVCCFLALTSILINDTSPQKMLRNAQRQDENRWTILILTVGSACASLLAIAFLLKSSESFPEWQLTLNVTLSLITIVSSWLLVHTMFALHYAHLYYRHSGANSEQAESLDFPSEKLPDYWDFLYFSFVIGMTCQVSDVQIASRTLRRLALVHGILTFFFNTVILALGINILAGMI